MTNPNLGQQGQYGWVVQSHLPAAVPASMNIYMTDGTTMKGPGYRMMIPYHQDIQEIRNRIDSIERDQNQWGYDVHAANLKFQEYEEKIDKLEAEIEDHKLTIELLQDEKQMLIDQLNEEKEDSSTEGSNKEEKEEAALS